MTLDVSNEGCQLYAVVIKAIDLDNNTEIFPKQYQYEAKETTLFSGITNGIELE